MYQIFSVIINVLTSPFRFVSRLLGTDRALGQLRTSSGMFKQLSAVVGRFVPSGGFMADMRDSIQAWREEREYARLEKAEVPALYRPDAADFSQIYLTQRDQRFVIHIGGATHSTQATLLLREASEKPLALTFRRVNDAQFGAPFTLTIKGDCEAAVNGRSITGETPVPNRSRLVIDDDEYTVEYLAWQALAFAPRLEVGWFTNKGPVRHINEDAIGIAKSAYGQFFAVADGVGGGERGDLISEYAIRYMLTVFENNIRYNYDWLELIQRSMVNINQEVRRFGMQSQAVTGTTLTLVIIRGWDAFVGHIGDSRLYLVSGGTVTRVTKDHVRIVRRSSATVDSPLPTQLERNVLTQAIGKNDQIEPQLVGLRLQPGDHLLLMTDGIAMRIEDEELVKLTSDYRPKTLPEHMAVLANQRFNADNLSAIHVHVKSTTRRTLWRPEAAERVYVTGAASASLKLSAPLSMRTNYRRTQRRRQLLIWLILFIMVGVFALAIIQRNQAPITPILSASITPSATVTPTPTPSPTRRPPTATAVPPTITPSPTFIPPTSTLAPLPTSTLALPPRRQAPHRKGLIRS